MTSANPHKVAIIADAHFHDLYGDYDFAGIETERGNMAARRLWDTARSTRVFNESYFALRAALDEVVQHNIKHVVLLGDYSDDGQRSTLKALERLLDEYRVQHGLIFTATVGNHDIFGPAGRHHGKRLLNADGTYSFVASTDSFIDEDASGFVLTDKMYCDGYPAGLQHIADLGFFHRKEDIYWETPFGTSDAPADRLYEIASPDGENIYQLMDASYLVEPEPGLWLLMIDANVFVPRNGAFQHGLASAFEDSTNAGWNAMVQHKRFVLDWMKDVAHRAKEQGKHLLTCSHYPAVDMLDGTDAMELELIGHTAAVKRKPLDATSQAIMQTGVGVHFSGHLHINDTARFSSETGALINVGVPSLVAFPPAFKIVTIDDSQMQIETVLLDEMKLNVSLQEQYRKETAVTGRLLGKLIDTEDYGHFLSAHVGELVVHRYIRKEWPSDLVAAFHKLSINEIIQLGKINNNNEIMNEFDAKHHNSQLSLIELLGDWYRLRKGSELAFDWIEPERIELYRALIALYKGQEFAPESVEAKLALLFRMMEKYMGGLPSRNLRINLETYAVEAV